MRPPLPAPWVELLRYLDGVGYSEIYLPLAHSTGAQVAPAVPARSSRPESTSAHISKQSSEALALPRAAAPISKPKNIPATATEQSQPLAADLEQLGAQAAACTACRLAERRHSVVFGSGAANADLMFIGEGPGAEEDRQGLPFVGAAGQLLSRILRAISLERDQVYIANAVKCRPPGNRNPQADEIAACSGFLRRQIDLVQPKVIVLLGKVAAQTLLGFDEGVPLYRMRDRWHTVANTPTRVTYHPAALLRNASYKRPTWDDMQVVRDRLREVD